MNDLTFFIVTASGVCWFLWLAYSLGFESGWVNGWEDRAGR